MVGAVMVLMLTLTRSCMQTLADLGRSRRYDAMRVARLATDMQVPRNKTRCPNPPPPFQVALGVAAAIGHVYRKGYLQRDVTPNVSS